MLISPFLHSREQVESSAADVSLHSQFDRQAKTDVQPYGGPAKESCRFTIHEILEEAHDNARSEHRIAHLGRAAACSS